MENNLLFEIKKKIEKYEKIVILRHIRPDGDAVGASLGLRNILRNSYPNKQIKCFAKDFVENLNFIDKEDDEEVMFYEDALAIVVDTATKDRISNEHVDLVKEVIKIDHHPNVDSYGVINYVEVDLSSTCELIVKIYNQFKDEWILDEKSAELLYMGMVTDSGRFKYSSTDGDTLRNAAVLLDKKINIEKLYANLYLKDFETFKLQSEVYKKMKITKAGVAYIYVDKKMQEKFNMTPQEASQMIGTLDSIKGSLIWLAFIDNPDGSIRVRLRSRFLDINDIAALYNGGGHGRASGATVENLMEMKFLIKDCNKKLRKFKKENKEWL